MEDRFHGHMRSKDPMDRLFAISKINQVLQDYTKRNFDVLDLKLMKGMFKRVTDVEASYM